MTTELDFKAHGAFWFHAHVVPLSVSALGLGYIWPGFIMFKSSALPHNVLLPEREWGRQASRERMWMNVLAGSLSSLVSPLESTWLSGISAWVEVWCEDEIRPFSLETLQNLLLMDGTVSSLQLLQRPRCRTSFRQPHSSCSICSEAWA